MAEKKSMAGKKPAAIGEGKKQVKSYHKGTIAKGKHDVAAKNVAKKYGIANKGK